MAQPAFQRHVDYWRTQLRDVAPTRLGSAAGTGNGVLRVRLSATVVEQVERCARRERLTTFMVLLGAFQLTLAAYADCDEVVCGTEVANRPWRSLAPAIGCFVNQLVIRTRCPRTRR